MTEASEAAPSARGLGPNIFTHGGQRFTRLPAVAIYLAAASLHILTMASPGRD
jgi:hypothetical protein